MEILGRTGAVLVLLAAIGCGRTSAPAEEVATSTDNATESAGGSGVVISQVYGGTGAPGALFNRDYVELFNRTAAPIPLARLSIHFAGPAGDFTPIAPLPANAVIPAGGYFLIGFGGGLQGADLKVDAGGLSVNILPINGKVALVRDIAVSPPTGDAAAQLMGCGSVDAGTCEPNARVVDLVGYGNASDHEGDEAAPAAARNKAILRKGAGCTDTGNNANDLAPGAPAPRNSKTTSHLCGAP